MKKPVFVLLIVGLFSAAGLGQQNVPFQGGIPVAPRGLAGKPLPDKPVEFDTGEGEPACAVRGRNPPGRARFQWEFVSNLE